VNSEEIKILSEEISTNGAAGEIIERPANVVKELIENALDAGADEIKIEITRGGKGLIKVSDNGKGIYPYELKKTILRFATSKIKSLEDLTNISTYGFRGEALAAISSISNFSIKSGRTGFNTYELCINFGKEISYSMVSPYRGTVVSVENIFMQMPARYKFLKSNASESREITKLVKQFIILNDKVTFHYYSDGKKIFHYPKGFDTLKRASELINEESLKFIEYNNEIYNIKAILSEPYIQKTRTDDIIIYVNGRIVKDNIIL
jgi:DNA mismatch repair protein MutL